MSIRTPKNHKNSHNTTVVLCWHEKKKLKAIRGNGYRFVPKGSTYVAYRNHHACCEKLIPKPAPNGTKNLPWHVDAAP